MADISKCMGTECPLRKICYRCTAEDDEEQTYLMFIPVKTSEVAIACDFFWFNHEKHIDDDGLKTFFQKYLDQTEKIGYSAGGSGHMAHKSVEIFLVKKLESTDNLKLTVGYYLYIESEFSTTKYTRLDVLQYIEGQAKFLNRLYDQMEDIQDDLGFN